MDPCAPQVHAAEGVAHRLEHAAEMLPFVGHHQHPQGDGSAQQAQQGAPLRMAKAAEGRGAGGEVEEEEEVGW